MRSAFLEAQLTRLGCIAVCTSKEAKRDSGGGGGGGSYSSAYSFDADKAYAMFEISTGKNNKLYLLCSALSFSDLTSLSPFYTEYIWHRKSIRTAAYTIYNMMCAFHSQMIAN